MVSRSHLADVIDLTFVGRYIVPLVVPVIVGVIGILMLDEAFNDDDDDEAEKARALVAARGRVGALHLVAGGFLQDQAAATNGLTRDG